MLLDCNLSGVYESHELNKTFEEYNKRVLNHINQKDRVNDLDSKAMISAYNNGFDKIKNEMIDSFASYEDISKVFNEFETEYDKLELKNKKIIKQQKNRL